MTSTTYAVASRGSRSPHHQGMIPLHPVPHSSFHAAAGANKVTLVCESRHTDLLLEAHELHRPMSPGLSPADPVFIPGVHARPELPMHQLAPGFGAARFVAPSRSILSVVTAPKPEPGTCDSAQWPPTPMSPSRELRPRGYGIQLPPTQHGAGESSCIPFLSVLTLVCLSKVEPACFPRRQPR
jgi:hypothetical protein